MNKKEPRKEPKRILPYMQKKLVVLYIIVLLAFVGLGLRLAYIINENETKYTKQILSQQQYDSVTLPFRRGDIVDANGSKLAVSEKVYNLVIDAKVINHNEKYFEPTMKALADNFALDMNAVREYVKNNPSSSSFSHLSI